MKNNAHEIMKALYLAVRDEEITNTPDDLLERKQSFINSLNQVQRGHTFQDENLGKPVLEREKAPIGLGKK